MKKLKIYLDTSVISYLDQPERREKMDDTLRLWQMIRAGAFEAVTSDVLSREILRCEEPKRSALADYLNEVDIQILPITEEMNEIAADIIRKGILRESNRDDCLHIAAALISGCDIIVSWNFKHLVNVKTIRGVREISLHNNYQSIDIYSPTFLLEEGEHHD